VIGVEPTRAVTRIPVRHGARREAVRRMLPLIAKMRAVTPNIDVLSGRTLEFPLVFNLRIFALQEADNV
jgi:hypothetical protein